MQRWRCESACARPQPCRPRWGGSRCRCRWACTPATSRCSSSASRPASCWSSGPAATETAPCGEGGQRRAGRRQPGDGAPAAPRRDPSARGRAARAATPASPLPPRRRPTCPRGGRCPPAHPVPGALSASTSRQGHRIPSTGWPPSRSSASPGRTRSSRSRDPALSPRRSTRVVTTVEAALAAEGVTLLATDLDTDGGKFFLGSGVPSHPRGRRGPDAARPAPDRRRRPATPPPARRQPWPRLRGRGRRRATRGLLGHGRHHQHGGPDHGHGADRRHPRAPRCAGALPHPLRRDTRRSLHDEGQGRSHVGLRRRRGDRHARGRRRLPPALPRPGGGDCDRPCGRSRRR